jgi:site-specific DNA-cytosine methylase
VSLCLQIVGWPVDLELYADLKPHARKYVMHNFKGDIGDIICCKHVIQDFREAQWMPKCYICGFSHNMVLMACDILVVGPPCQPVCRSRHKKGDTPKTGSAENHPGFAIMQEDLIRYLEWRKPRYIITENVVELNRLTKKQSADSATHLKTYMLSLAKIGYVTKAKEWAHSAWAKATRFRYL